MGARRRVEALLAAVAILSLLTMGCFGVEDIFGEDTADREAREEERIMAPPPMDVPNPSGRPEIVLEYSANDMQSLPVYRATLVTPIIVENRDLDEPTHYAHMSGTREDDAAAIGNGPGTITQTTEFVGTYDPSRGVLKGTLTHTYRAVMEATADALAATTEYSMTGTLEAKLVQGTDRLEGTVRGPTAKAKTTASGKNAPSPIVRTFQIDWVVSGQLPEALVR